MCFVVSWIKLFLKIVDLKKIDGFQEQRFAAEYKLVCKFQWSCANDAIYMKKFY